jgi:hypothetical protein
MWTRMRISCGQYVWILCVNVSFLSTSVLSFCSDLWFSNSSCLVTSLRYELGRQHVNLEDVKGVIRSHISKCGQYNGQEKKRYNRANNDIQNITQKPKYYRPFNFKDNTRVRIFIFAVAKFFPEINIRLYEKNSESNYFFFPPPKSEYFFQQHWESEYFFRKNLQVKWLYILPFILHIRKWT